MNFILSAISDPSFLVVIAFVTSGLTATLGLGGGVLLLALMPSYMPFTTAIPLHGAVQLASNVSRWIVDYKTVKWSLIPSYAFGTVIGVTIGYFCLGKISDDYLPFGLGIFIMLLVWTPLLKKAGYWLKHMSLVAFIQSFFSLFVGSTGLLSPPILIEKKLSKNEIITTHAVQMSLMHIMKVIAFTFAGVSLAHHGGLLFAMIIASIFGSWAGSKLRGKISEEKGSAILKLLLTILAVKLICSPMMID